MQISGRDTDLSFQKTQVSHLFAHAHLFFQGIGFLQSLLIFKHNKQEVVKPKLLLAGGCGELLSSFALHICGPCLVLQSRKSGGAKRGKLLEGKRIMRGREGRTRMVGRVSGRKAMRIDEGKMEGQEEKYLLLL